MNITESRSVFKFCPKYRLIFYLRKILKTKKFVKVTDKEVANAFGLKKKGVAIVRPAIQEIVNYLPGKVTKEALISFFEDYGTPLIIDYNEGRETRTFFHWTLTG